MQFGDPRFAVLAGEAGIGKTRLMEHVAEQAAACGMRVLRTGCVELGAEGLPLAPVTAALRQLVREIGIERLSAMLPAIDALLRLLPELGAPEKPGAPEKLGTADSGHDSQGRLFELFATLLGRLGAEQPLVLLVDDLQWADRGIRR